MTDIYLCQLRGQAIEELQNTLNAIKPTRDHLILLPEYLNWDCRLAAELVGVEQYLTEHSRLRECHLVTSLVNARRENWTACFNHGQRQDLYWKSGNDGTSGIQRRQTPWTLSESRITIANRSIVVLACMDYEMLSQVPLSNEIVLLPSHMAANGRLKNGRIGKTVPRYLHGNHVLLANGKSDGCCSFYADPTGMIRVSAETALSSVVAIAIPENG